MTELSWSQQIHFKAVPPCRHPWLGQKKPPPRRSNEPFPDKKAGKQDQEQKKPTFSSEMWMSAFPIREQGKRHNDCIKERMCSDRRREDKAEIAREIMAYLAKHPNAGDTLEGIVQWWLLQQKINREAHLVSEVISGLAADGLLRVDHGLGATQPVYRLKRQVKDAT